jgi:signal transduction histidine kinase
MRPIRLRYPRGTIRLRLTILYASLFLASGVGLLAITYLLVRHATDKVLVGTGPGGRSFVITKDAPAPGPLGKGSMGGKVFGRVAIAADVQGPLQQPPTTFTQRQLEAQAQRDMALAERQHTAELHQLLEQSGIALAIMAAVSIALGWLAAGRVLRPLRTINERARTISASNLHKRLALAGPDDEITQLANTFDDLLGRLDASFTAQRQFVANASHELRTPLTRAQAVAEVALGDPEATVGTLRASHERVLAAGKQQERLIEALLTLARSERGLDEREPFDLAAVTATVLHARRDEAERRGLYVHATLEPAETSGDPRLAERLVANLLDNALRHNTPQGRIDITTTSRNGRAVLSVANTGPLVPAAELERLLQPFQRLCADRTDQSDGTGLGLSIVVAIATAHGATLTTRPQRGGGLDVEVDFPAIRAGREPAPILHRPVLARRTQAAARPQEM